MTVQVVGAAEAERLFTVLRDSTFGWTVAEVPELMRTLGWAIDEEVDGKGVVAHTPWGLPAGTAALLFRKEDQTVLSIKVRTTSQASEEPADRLALLDAFAGLSSVAARVLGPPTASIPDDLPSIQWRLPAATVTIQNTGVRVLVNWIRNDYQDFRDSVGY